MHHPHPHQPTLTPTHINIHLIFTSTFTHTHPNLPLSIHIHIHPQPYPPTCLSKRESTGRPPSVPRCLPIISLQLLQSKGEQTAARFEEEGGGQEDLLERAQVLQDVRGDDYVVRRGGAVYTRVYNNVCICLYVSIHTYIYICIYIYIYVYICVYVYLNVCVLVYTFFKI